MFDVQKKWTIIVSYGGATEDMKLAICFRHEYIGLLTVSISVPVESSVFRANRPLYHVSYTPAGETGSKITIIKTKK